MRAYLDFFKGIQQSLIWVLIGSIAGVLLIDLFIRECIPEKGLFFSFINIVYTVCISFIASFVFYCIQVHLKEVKDKKKILPSVESLYFRLLSYVNDIIVDIIRGIDSSKKIDSISNVTKEEFISAAKRVRFDLSSSVFSGDTKLTWLQYFSSRQKQIEECRKNVLDFAHFLDEECISLLADIRNDAFLFTLVILSSNFEETGHKANFDMDGAESFFEQYYDLAMRMNKFYSEQLEPFKDKNMAHLKEVYKGENKQIIL